MSVGLQVWSQTASANSTIDTNISWPEGMAPSQVNDSARAMMASMAKWRDDQNGTIVTGGTTTAFTVTSNQVSTGLVAGYTISVQFNATADTSATLNVDSNGAKPMQIAAGTNLQGGEFTAGDVCRFTYSSTGSGQWIAHGPQAYIQNSNQIAANKVTYGKIQQASATTLLGNPTGGSANVEEITLGTNLSFSGTVLNAGSSTPVITTILSTSTATWQSTTQNGNFPLYLRVRMVGGGGGGGAQATNAGNNGNDTSFGSWTAIHGAGGAAASGTPGAGGSGGANGTGTQITRISGQGGQPGFTSSAGDIFAGGDGGISPFGGGAGGGAGNTTGASAQANSGSGGMGGGGSGTASGSGGGAGEFVEFIVTSPSTSYNVAVGSGGTGGAAGALAGGNGATGRIEVIAYWQ